MGVRFEIETRRRLCHVLRIMKTRFLISVICSAFFVGVVSAQQPATSESYYRQGLAAEQAGDPDAARAAYMEALKLNPHNADATFRLGQLKHRRELLIRQGRQTAFNGVMLPEIRFDEASLRESLDALAKVMETQSDGKVAPNFIIQDAEGKFSDAKISLELRNVTSGAVFKYILDMVNARARYDEFAVVILPN
jgi:tetratricopeptide (TPR) repeat protein